MNKFTFNDIKNLCDWRESIIKRFNKAPIITAKIVNGERIFTARIDLQNQFSNDLKALVSITGAFIFFLFFEIFYG